MTVISLGSYRASRTAERERRDQARRARWAEVADGLMWLSGRSGEQGRKAAAVARDAGLAWEDVTCICLDQSTFGGFALMFEDGSVATAAGMRRVETVR